MINSKIHTVFFDLDNTLINSTFIKEHLFRWAESYGFSRDEAVLIYNAAKGKGDCFEFNLDNFQKELNVHLVTLGKPSVSNGAVWRWYKELISCGSELILPGAINLLDFCKEQEIACFILTLGNASWQRQKINFSGLNNFFLDDKIITTNQKDILVGKCKKIKDYIHKYDQGHRGEGITVFNDSVSEVFNMLQEFPCLNAFLRNGLTEEQKKQFDPYADRFFVSESLEVLQQAFERIL